MPKITNKDKKPGRSNERVQMVAKTTEKSKQPIQSYQWWAATNDHDLAAQLISTANYLQKSQQYRIRQASIYSRVYSGKPLLNYALNSKLLDVSNQLPLNKPTMNVTQSCVDTLVSRITQSRPKPIFLTDNGDYKERSLSKQLNAFINGEFYRSKAYELGNEILRDSAVLGDGLVKIYEKDKRVALERVLETEVFVDRNDAYYGKPRQLIHLKIADRSVVAALDPKMRKIVEAASRAYVDGSAESSETVSDQIILVEGWHLPSGPDADDGRHVIACSSGVLLDEPWKKDNFPFVKLSYNSNLVGWFSQGLAELLMGTQIEINKLLITMSQAINLIGVPRIFIDELSKVLETAFNNNIGTIIKYRGNKPIYEVAQCIPQEMYDHLQRLITYAYQQSGISALSAISQKPPGLNSGEAIRSYDDLQTDRFAALAKRYETFYIDLAYQMIDLAKEIAERDGSYSTVYPNKDGTREIDLPKAAILKDSYVIQCYDESSLPHDPAGRYARLSEMLASGEITLQEFRRLSGFPDLEQSDKLANALEERILQILDNIVESGKYTAPDPFLLDPTNLATSLTVNYINLYASAKLEEKKMQMLRDFFTQVQVLQQAATAPPPMPIQPINPNAQPSPVPPAAPVSAVSAVNG
jgi:hypothetical protein